MSGWNGRGLPVGSRGVQCGRVAGGFTRVGIMGEAIVVDARNKDEIRWYNQLDTSRTRTNCDVWDWHFCLLVILHGVSSYRGRAKETVFMTKTVCACINSRAALGSCTLNILPTTGLLASWCVLPLCSVPFLSSNIFFKFTHFQWSTNLSLCRLAQHAMWWGTSIHSFHSRPWSCIHIQWTRWWTGSCRSEREGKCMGF